MTPEELKQIYCLNKEIKMWQKELEKIQCKSLAKGQEITGMPFGGGTSDHVSDMAATIYDIEKIIQGKLAEIQLAKKRIMEYINTLGDSYVRQIVYLRNVSCLKWEEISDELGGTAASIKMMYFRFLKAEQ